MLSLKTKVRATKRMALWVLRHAKGVDPLWRERGMRPMGQHTFAKSAPPWRDLGVRRYGKHTVHAVRLGFSSLLKQGKNKSNFVLENQRTRKRSNAWYPFDEQPLRSGQ